MHEWARATSSRSAQELLLWGYSGCRADNCQGQVLTALPETRPILRSVLPRTSTELRTADLLRTGHWDILVTLTGDLTGNCERYTQVAGIAVGRTWSVRAVRRREGCDELLHQGCRVLHFY